MALPHFLVNPRQQQPGNRQSDIELQQIKVRMGKLEKRMAEMEAKALPDDYLNALITNIPPDVTPVLKAKRGPGRPPKEKTAA